jgi:hypothetical protein
VPLSNFRQFICTNGCKDVAGLRFFLLCGLYTQSINPSFAHDYPVSRKFSDRLFSRPNLEGIISGYLHKFSLY